MECVICMERIEGDEFRTSCGHEFHRACIQGWMVQNSCPICRSAIDASREIRLTHDPAPEDDLETAEDVQREMYEDVLLPEGIPVWNPEAQDVLPPNHPLLVRTFEFDFGQCCVCMRNVEIFRALTCNVCHSSYYCSEECRNRATLRHHVCQMEDNYIPEVQNTGCVP